MALITCKSCGKKISDTVEKCIHCGEPIKIENKEPEQEKVEIEEQKKKYNEIPTISKVNKKEFKKLPEREQIELEQQFVDSNVKFYKIKRREEEHKKISFFAWIMFFLPVVAIVALGMIVKNFSLQPYNPELYELGITIAGSVIIICVLIIILNFIISIIDKKSIKKYIYMKGFKLWLDKEKDIDFSPPFFDDHEKAIFDEIDLETIEF